MDFYHALNRGVDKRVIFHDDQDRARFVHDMFEFNSADTPLGNARRRTTVFLHANTNTGRQMVDLRSRPLVKIHGWVLMDNHYHLLLSGCTENGIALFLRRLNIGYAKYYNEKYKRSGTLFQGRTKKILIDNDAYLLHILNYIHFNPLDMLPGAAEWRELKIKNSKEALTHLTEYRWSSYRDYVGIKNFPSILTVDFFRGFFKDYRKETASYLADISNQELGTFPLE